LFAGGQPVAQVKAEKQRFYRRLSPVPLDSIRKAAAPAELILFPDCGRIRFSLKLSNGHISILFHIETSVTCIGFDFEHFSLGGRKTGMDASFSVLTRPFALRIFSNAANAETGRALQTRLPGARFSPSNDRILR
jgi:hypothetical protein